MTTPLNKGYIGIVKAVAFNKESSSIEVILTSSDQSRLMRHRVGAMQGITKKESRVLWEQLHTAMDNGSTVQFFYRGNWKAWFDVLQIVEADVEESFTAMIGM